MTSDDFPTCLLYIFGIILSAGLALNVVFLLRLSSRRLNLSTLLDAAGGCAWNVSDALRLFGALAICHGLLYVILMSIHKVADLSDNTMSILAFGGHMVFFHGVVLLYTSFLLRRNRERWVDLLGTKPNDWLRHVAHGIAYYMAAMPPVLLAGWVYTFFLTDWGYPVGPDDVQDIVQFFLNPDFPYPAKVGAAVAGITLVPVAEEILFRAMALRLLVRSTGKHLAVFLVSTCFAILHMHIPSIVPLFVFSVALCWGYMHTGSLMVPIIMHSAFNSVAILSSFLRVSNVAS